MERRHGQVITNQQQEYQATHSPEYQATHR